jgi:hypothetical protein
MSDCRRATFPVSGHVALVTLCRIADGPVEKVPDQPIEFLLLIELQCGIC